MKIEQLKIIKLFAKTKNREDIVALLDGLNSADYLNNFDIIAEELRVAVDRTGCVDSISLAFTALSKYLNVLR